MQWHACGFVCTLNSWGEVKLLNCHGNLVCTVMLTMAQCRPCTCMLLMLQCSCTLAEEVLYPCRGGVVTSTIQAHVLPCVGTDYLQAAISLADMDHAVCTQVLPIRPPMYPILECGETSSTACLNKASVCFKVCCGIHISTCPIIDFLSLFFYRSMELVEM